MTEASMNGGGRRLLTSLVMIIIVSMVLAACGVPPVGEPDPGDTSVTASSTTSTTTTSTTEFTTSRSTTSTIGPKSTSRTSTSEPDSSVPAGWTRVDVVEVIDGDTIEVRFEDGSQDTLRLIGINAPEGGECFAAEATAGLAELIGAETVLLEPDQSDRDQFDRLLRYVWTPDEQFVNAIVVEEGWAIAREYPPDTARADQLAEAQQVAQDEGAGLWAPDACGSATSTDIQIAHIEYDAPGNDNFNLNGEWVEIANGEDTAVDLTGWILKDESATHRYEFPAGFRLDPGASVQIYTGCGQDSAMSLYWCKSGSAVWNNSGDTAFLLDPTGNVVWSYAYG